MDYKYAPLPLAIYEFKSHQSDLVDNVHSVLAKCAGTYLNGIRSIFSITLMSTFKQFLAASIWSRFADLLKANDEVYVVSQWM
jgi:hypothetical protein